MRLIYSPYLQFVCGCPDCLNVGCLRRLLHASCTMQMRDLLAIAEEFLRKNVEHIDATSVSLADNL